MDVVYLAIGVAFLSGVIVVLSCRLDVLLQEVGTQTQHRVNRSPAQLSIVSWTPQV